ncbi:alkylhydroperoxidase [Aquirufa nivalisilvae]|jgi:alkyl hydroperoxide reductase subunit D|uniref:carboxymuconolactone decarboxylase family protein n=1 Tax=Aquirufa nivalisilvae TaxID=2516557 RepID=UPI001032D6DF|nr:carboxymuconolactone decarboxylase family protein [Aquirufa nivalisilvae]MCZ2480202.1 alkylhydroperoxidase [Aquirufa nivalisilvae]MCZ2482403.1 alkylhydroperoxidase [Aquirufa nivalisilvae]TBH73788.1 alkylhydroperoxidase [Aquirufa nivalisilvae]
MSETRDNLLAEINLPATSQFPLLDQLDATDNRYIKDLKINVSNALKYATLTEKEAVLLALAVSVNQKHEITINSLTELAKLKGATEAEINEIHALTSLLNANNVFYRFKHFVGKEYYNTAPAGIRMSIMMNPVLGKEFFELASLTVSAINGCEMCVKSHEQSVINHGATEARIMDAIRLTAIFKSLIVLL